VVNNFSFFSSADVVYKVAIYFFAFPAKNFFFGL